MDDSNLKEQLAQALAQLAQVEANLKKLLNGTRSQVEQRQQSLNLLPIHARK